MGTLQGASARGMEHPDGTSGMASPVGYYACNQSRVMVETSSSLAPLGEGIALDWGFRSCLSAAELSYGVMSGQIPADK